MLLHMHFQSKSTIFRVSTAIGDSYIERRDSYVYPYYWWGRKKRSSAKSNDLKMGDRTHFHHNSNVQFAESKKALYFQQETITKIFLEAVLVWFQSSMINR